MICPPRSTGRPVFVSRRTVMRRASLLFVPPLLLAVGRMNVRAQAARNTAAQPPATVAANTPANDNTKRAMTIADIGKWRTIRDVAISDDGQWASYGYQQRRVDDTLFVKQLPAGGEQKIPRASR